MNQELLNKWNILCDYHLLLDMWNENHRHYHNLNHLQDLYIMIGKDKLKYSQIEYEKLLLTALFHDCIYYPMSNDNEEKSSEFFMNCVIDKKNNDILEINQMILDTKDHKPKSELSNKFIEYDMNIVERSLPELIDWETRIALEFRNYGILYKTGRIKFIKSLLDKYPNNSINLLNLIEYIKNK